MIHSLSSHHFRWPLLTRCSAFGHPYFRSSHVRVQAFFGFGKSKDDVEAEKQAAFEAQQEILRARREKK